MDYRVISADDHIDLQFLPPDLWQKRVPAALRDRAPKVVETADDLVWVSDGATLGPWGSPNGQALLKTGAIRRWALERGGELRFGENRPATADLRLADMDRDGVDASVMYGPITPLFIKDPDLRKACYRAYNEWLAEFCAAKPERLLGVGLIPHDDPAGAAEELRHLKTLGIRQAMLLAARANPPLWKDVWEPLWQAGQETGIPIGFHLSGGVRSADESPEAQNILANRGVSVATLPLQMDEALAGVIFSGAMERYPGLKIVMAETGIGWIPYFMDRMNDTYRRFVDAEAFWAQHGGMPLSMQPSEYCRRQVWATFQIDPVGLRLLDYLGEDRVMWASDYPHADSTWPWSQQAITDQFGEVPAETQRRILCENARTLYNL